MATQTILKIAGIIVLLLLVVIIVLQNREDVVVQLLFVTVSMPLAALLTGTFILGFLIGVITLFLLQRQRKVIQKSGLQEQ